MVPQPKRPRRRRDGLLGIVSLAALLICLYFFFCYAFLATLPGYDYDGRWTVVAVDARCTMVPSPCSTEGTFLQWGDQIEAITVPPPGSPPGTDPSGGTRLTFAQYSLDRRPVPFAGTHEGDYVLVNFTRDGQSHEIQIVIGSQTIGQRLWLLIGLLFMLPFWLAGSIVLLYLRPRDLRWTLLVATNFLTAIWISSGLLSPFRVAGSSLVMRSVSWLMLPVFLHLHLLVPTPLLPARWRRWLMLLYGLSGLMALAELLLPTPSSGYYVALLVAIGGSLGLLIFRSFVHLRPADRLSTRFMLLGVLLGFGPGLLAWVIPVLLRVPISGATVRVVTVAGLPLQPLFYLYVVYKRQMGGLEFRTNRLLSLYSFMVLFGLGFLVVFLVGGNWAGLSPESLTFALVVSTIFVMVALMLRPGFQRFIDRLAYGTEYNADTIIRTFADQIPRALDTEALARLLTKEVLPALLIRQSALYALHSQSAPVVYADGVAPYAPRHLQEELDSMLQLARRYLSPESLSVLPGSFAWVRLTIPIEVGGKRIGAWLLGKRDPDDYYPQPDIELLSTLGNQIGVALETARLIESMQRRASELETAYRDLQRLDQLKDEFVQNVSHELRTPLTFVRGYVDLLLEELFGPLNSQQEQALRTVSDRTEGIIRLVNDIISLQQASVESSLREPVSLPALARSCLEAAEIAARKRETSQLAHVFQLDVVEGVPPVMADRRRLAQVIDNLLGNAVKFSPNGGAITVRVFPCVYQRPGQPPLDPVVPAVALEVCDEGIGIAASEIERIWQRFYQVDGSSTRRFGGMGLGLAIVHTIVENHAGYVIVTSEPGKGSSFRVVLPVAPATGAASTTDDGLASLVESWG